jgi:N-acetyl-gamma-glutamylphosphate reductase
VDEGFAYINALEDNLGKGAASQGVENMNLMLGFDRLHGISPVYSTN